MRSKILVGNWKMNKFSSEAKTFVDTEEKKQKKKAVMKYAESKALKYGEVGKKIQYWMLK